ncbi:type 1 glutamine amidotransferase domain-containing protein [Nocardia sp. BMG51109]|uniref:type 1 glutamine amidotransferase domain-containing protein n=1 Tax=Nocardia sp. BMG51109 TaxID=1056816 RepID=UPI0004661C4F|nr:type 1 glutamine amidotransferase domain-containing protein [Nocardia sp. BMG51109]
MPAQLEGARVLVVTSNAGVEHDELLVPRDRLRERGASVRHAAMKGEAVRTYRHDLDPDETVQPDVTLDAVAADEVDALVVPGGTVNADTLRTDDRARELVRALSSAGKPIAAICHGPWLLVDAGVLPGKTLTSYPSLRTDIGNAGGTWVDRSVVRCPQNGWTLITSRRPDDLPDFVDALTDELTG